MTPQHIVSELDRFIVGQQDAKKAVAIALRNRWRRMQLPVEIRNEVTNIGQILKCWITVIDQAIDEDANEFFGSGIPELLIWWCVGIGRPDEGSR